MLNYLKRPFPVRYTPWKVIITASGTIFLLLILFQPFGLSYLKNESDKWMKIIGFTIITAISVSTSTILLPFLFKGYYDIRKWTIGKYLLNTFFIIFFIAIGNFSFDWITMNHPKEIFWSVFSSYFISAFIVGLIPSVIITFLTQNYYLRQNLREAEQLNLKLQTFKEKENKDNKTIVTLAGTTKEAVTLEPQNILYIEANGNYTAIHYLSKQNEIKKILLRTTISLISEKLKEYSIIQRCHRAYLINLTFIMHVEGNMQGFLVKIKHTSNKIPVSRKYTKSIKEKLEHINPPL